MMIILFLAASSTTVLCKLRQNDCRLFLPYLDNYYLRSQIYDLLKWLSLTLTEGRDQYVCTHYKRADEKIFTMQRVVLTELQGQGVMLQH
jgi:hypothetical protein